VFVLVAAEAPRTIVGYFTLCAYALPPEAIPDETRRVPPRYPLVSATLIGRLAVASSRQGEGQGGALLAHALRKAFESASSVGSSMVVVDALDEHAAAFYGAHGFIRLPESMRLVLPMRTVETLFAAGPGLSKRSR
jgi:predicted GNAT family N-acyltransferase